MIRTAAETDLPEIMRIVAATLDLMREEGNDQWNADYPRAEDFLTDIRRGELIASEDNGRVNGFACVNADEPEEYGAVPWTRPGPATVVHRLAVDPAFRKQGIASALMRRAEDLAAEAGTGYLRSDTYSLNPRMNALFKKLGYRYAGDIDFKGRRCRFHCYEKLVGG